MTKKQLKAIRDRVKVTSAGPWQADGPGLHGGYFVRNKDGVLAHCLCFLIDDFTMVPAEANADFIAQARQDVLDLLDEVDRLRADK